MTRKQVMQKLVKEEATNIKKNALKSELRRLSFKNLNPDSKEKCIYGQMTGNCDNYKATELIKQCCKRVYVRGNGDITNAKLNGNPKDCPRYSFWSPVEVFIIQDKNKENGNNEKLIDYLKGKTEILEFV
jgi:hypothetical protein